MARARRHTRRGAQARARSRQRLALWRERARLAGRWTLWGTLAVGAAAGLRAAALWVVDPATLPVHSLEIAGRPQHTAPDALRSAAAAAVDGGLLSVDVDRVRRAVEALPWVAKAEVRRVWPDRLRISVREQRAVALWGSSERDGRQAGERVLNAAAEAFRPALASVPAGLPRLAGPPGTRERVLSAYRRLVDVLGPSGRRPVALTLDARRAWQLRLDNGLEVRFGRHDLWERAARFTAAYPRLLAGHEAELEYVDMRYANGFAVRWREAQEIGQTEARARRQAQG